MHAVAENIEQYRPRFASERPETYDALVAVWQKVASRHFTGWAYFSQCALAEPAKVRDHPADVQLAEQLMLGYGYQIGPTTRRGARRWVRSAFEPLS